jgi:hypothetical protein
VLQVMMLLLVLMQMPRALRLAAISLSGSFASLACFDAFIAR